MSEEYLDNHEPAAPPVKLLKTFKLFSIISFRILLFYFCAYGIINWLIYAWLLTFLKSHFNLGLGEVGISATVYIQIGSFAGSSWAVFWQINGYSETRKAGFI